MVELSINSMEGMGFEPMSCIHGFIPLTLKKQLQTKLKNYRYIFNLQRKVYVEHQNLVRYLQNALS